MRKRVVLQSQPCPPPEREWVEGTKEGWYSKPRRIYTIAKAQLLFCEDNVNNVVLNIDIYRYGELKARYFADKYAESHRVLIIDTGEWKQLCMQNVANVAAGMKPNYSEYNYTCDVERWEYELDEDRECVLGYLGERINYWESGVMSSKRYTQLANRQRKIDTMMAETIPDIPEDFYRWLHEDIFGQRHLFQRKLSKMTRMQCTACGKQWLQKKAMGIGMKLCPKCGRTVKGTYKAQEQSAEKSVYLLQPCKKPGMWVERYFRARCIWSPEHVSQVSIDERIRAIVPDGEDWGKVYYEDGVDGSGNRRFWDANHFSTRMIKGYLYPGTLPQMKDHWPDTLARSGIEILAAGGVSFNVNHMIISWHKVPCMEYIIKGGFHR
ncbi:MAG: hypothetical protein IJG15_07110, partial [Lachnospiraceae bacterium]|nr:hypothetical protein [Lachnospiraceae bacterium]